jgi:2-polyprenyl-3-methyl-5-hydroxy-6-metoxy-1,4-benzoquinol methylase
MPDAALAAKEQEILHSWHTNAAAWVGAVAERRIESRRLVTDAAILHAVAGDGTQVTHPYRILDVGCGEGWLAHALNARGFEVYGMDAVDSLIAAARARGEVRGRFDVCSYGEFAARNYPFGDFDAAVCNFSLLGDSSVKTLLAALPNHLARGRRLLIQTLHPLSACGDQPYADGWRPGSWSGFDDAFRDPAPWYFRTLESWVRLLQDVGFEIRECREPALPTANRPASIIFIAEVQD